MQGRYREELIVTRNSILRSAVAAVGGFLLLFLLALWAREATMFHTWMHRGFSDSQMTRVSKAPYVVRLLSVQPADFTSAPIPFAGDTVIAVNDTAVAEWRPLPVHFYSPVDDYPPDKPVYLTYRHGSDTLRTSFTMHGPPRRMILGQFLLELLRFLTTMLSIGVGLWTLRNRSGTGTVRVFAFYSFAIACATMLSYWLFPGSYAAFDLPYSYNLQRFWFLFGCLYGGLWLHLLCVYPRPLTFVQRHRRAVALCYIPTALILLLWINRLYLHGVLAPGLSTAYEVNLAFSLMQPIPLLLSIGVLIYRYRNSVNRLETRQVRLILWAAMVGIVLMNVDALLNWTFPAWFFGRWYRGTSIGGVHFAATLLGPLAFAYAFRKYRLMDVEGSLKRATRSALMTGILILLLIGITYGISQLMLVTLGVTSRTPTMALAFVLALGILPAQRRLRELVERRLYPERQKLRKMLQDFLQQSSALPDKLAFWKELEGHLKEGLKVAAVYPVLKGSMPSAFAEDSLLLNFLAQSERPLLVDEAQDSGRVHLTEAESHWLAEAQIGLLLPLVMHRNLIGFLAIGLRTDQEDYNAEELQILNSLAPQIAIASQNLTLLEENVGKRELEQQLQMARRIQEGFLPRQIPATPGLEVAAISRFCLDVAGDYYDVIPLKDGRTVLAIGDVSGKGAGAAMIMANLQAALRTAVRMNIPLAETVSEINLLIHQNTPPEQYITFFVAIFDPLTSLLSYVNAGHNAPMLARADGTVELLQEGGMILGCMPGGTYTQAQTKLRSGDVLFLFTDGVTEAMNAEDVEFGEERVGKVVLEHFSASPQAVLDIVEHEVVAHHGATTFDDDFTLLMIKKT